MEVIQKMQKIKTLDGESKSDWHKLMKDVDENFNKIYSTAWKAPATTSKLLYASGIDILNRYFKVFVGCMLKWCMKEDGSANKDFVEILTDVETHFADTVRFIIQHSRTGDASFDGKDFSNIDHLLPRMYKACLHVLTAHSSPPNFNISQDSLRTQIQDIEYVSWENRGSARIYTLSQISKVRTLSQFVCRITDKITHGYGKALMICLESLLDKVACLAFLGCWERYYNNYLSYSKSNVHTLFDGWVRKISALPLYTSPVAIWTDQNLKIHTGYVQQLLLLIQKDRDVDLTRQEKDQLDTLCCELDIIVYVQINWVSQLDAEQGSNLAEIQALVRSIESLALDYVINKFTTQTEDINHVIQSRIQSLLASVLEAWILQFSSCTTLPLTDEFLIQFVKCVQQVSSRKLQSLLAPILKAWILQFSSCTTLPLTDEFLIQFTECVQRVSSRMIQSLLAHVLKAWILQFTSCTTRPLTDEFLIQFTEFVKRVSSRLLKDDDILPRGSVKDEIEFLQFELEILINFHINYVSQRYADQGLNLAAVRMNVQTVASKIASFILSSLINEIKHDGEKVIFGLHNLLTSILEAWLVPINNVLPLTDEYLIQFTKCVQQISSRMLKDENIIPRDPVKDQIQFLNNELRILINFYINYPSKLYANQGLNLVTIRTEVQIVAWKIASFIYSSLISETKQDGAKVVFGLQNLLTYILRAWAMQLTINNVLPLVDEILIQFKESIEHVVGGALKDESAVAERHYLQMCNVFKFKENQSPEEETPRNITTQVLVQMRSIASNINTFTGDQTKYLGPNTSLPQSDLVNKFAHLKAQVMDAIYLRLVCKLRQVTSPTCQLNFINFLLDNMKQLMSSGLDLIGELEDEMQAIHEALIFFRDFLESLRDDSVVHLQDICKRVVSVSYEAEHLVYSIYNGSYPASCTALWISHFAQEIESTKVSVLNIFEKKENVGINIHDSMGDQNYVPSQALIPAVDSVVGFKGEMERVIRKLVATQHLKTLDVVSIIGMPGLGKTTLARKIYEDRQIVDHFTIRAWCVVSNEYNKKDLLLTILGCMIELTDTIQKTSEVELSTLLHKQLVGRRYLVVMDDVWGIDSFEFLKPYLPDNENGCRIVLTSRYRVIGMKAKHHSDPIELPLLTNDQSWLLLSKKVYRDEEFPMELCLVGKRIAESCKGLPLAIVVVGGLLAKSQKTREFWDQVAENLSSYISQDSQAQGMEVLDLSYKHMPHHLKPLFLYIGAFPEDREIPIENLIWLWIAEGFVRDNKQGTLEHQAELYLMDLIDRSFLTVAARRADGRVKTCTVHDLLREMCLLKAKEECLLQQINVHDDLPNPISYQKRLSVLLQRRNESVPAHLISSIVPTKPFIAFEDLSTLSLTPPLYSFLFFNKNNSLPLWKEAVASVLCDLKLLRILHFESTFIDSNRCGDVMMLVHLRYISIRVAWTSIPSSVSNLRNLETLIIKGLRGEIGVPDAIWELVKLRHLHINDRAKFREPSDKSSMLQNLETLSTPALCRGEDVKLMKRLPNARKLRCIFLESCPQLEWAKKIESLKAIYTGVGRCPWPFVVPSTLKKLSLSKFRLKWEEISKLHEIPQLEVLNLRNGAVDGESWDMDEDEDEFLELKVLKLENLNIRSWTACELNFPCLEKLILKKCKQLMGIPNELADNNCLQEMEVLSCSKNAAISAECIENKQKVAGNESLEVRIHPPVNLGSSS